MNQNDSLLGINMFAPQITVRHSELRRVDDSEYKSCCPACKVGLLLMRRNPHSFNLESKDNCVLCGQMVEYTDIPDNQVTSLPINTGD